MLTSRREFLATGAAALFAGGTRLDLSGLARAAGAPRPFPSPSQLAWQRDEMAVFIHFGVNTFTDREWGDGTEDPKIFDPAQLDARQWARAAREGGARAMVLTAKHHDGFCLWPTRTTQHSVASSPFRGGSGDVVREFVDACRAEGLRPGLYLSPWDRNSPAYGDSARYNDLYCDQLTELLTRYGPIAEVWFDGANGEGPNGRKQVYDWARFWGLVRQLQPDAVMFSDAGPDVRWCGNEKGLAGDPNWSTVDPTIVPYPGADSPRVQQTLVHGDVGGSVWRPAEVDVSIRPGWFHHPAEDDKVRSVDNLVELWLSSVGRNGKLLLNVPPTRDGLLHPTDVANLAAFGRRMSAAFQNDLTSGAVRAWRKLDSGASLLIELPRPQTISAIRLMENIEKGQTVNGYTVAVQADKEKWRFLSPVGTTIGYTKVERLEPTTVKRLRILIDSLDDEDQEPIVVRLY